MNSQKGVSVLSRGRKGHIVTQETKDKIRSKKLGSKQNRNSHLIITELQHQYYQRAVTTLKIIPDAILFRDGKLIALEIERERWESGIRQKMAIYDHDTNYDEVIIVWYDLEGNRIKEFHKKNGEWSVNG